jgi:hypothetical protein
MSNKKQTAVEWYAEQEIELTLDFISKKINYFEYGIKKLRLIEQAKEMEKQQIKEACNQGYYDGYKDNGNNPEQYYKETYEQ